MCRHGIESSCERERSASTYKIDTNDVSYSQESITMKSN